MRQVLWSASLVVGAVLGTGMTAHAAAFAHELMPVPAQMEWGQGVLAVDRPLSLSLRGPVQARSRVAAALARLHPRLESRPGGSGHSLKLTWREPGLAVPGLGEDESYELVVDAQGVRLGAANPLGILRGLTTLGQLVRDEKGRRVIPTVHIVDRPRFAWRGLLIDPCRHWLPVEVVKRTLDGMEAVKLNVLHWHLSDDQGFRVESKTYPKLQQMGAEGLFYTQDQVRDVIAYARDRGIRVLPEFDMPGHTTSWLVGYPELGSAPGPYELIHTYGVFNNNLDPSRDEVYGFVQAFWTEMAALFPDEYVHIGGDEVTPMRWNANEQIQAFLYANELRDARDLQAFFNKRVVDILGKIGKKVVGWDEVLHPDLPKGVVVQSWRGGPALVHAVQQGHDALLSGPYYLDHMLSAEAHYRADPIPADVALTDDEKRHVLGGEACMWGEYTTPETLDLRIWPRAAAVAERFWSPAEVRDVDDMYRRLERTSQRLEAIGLTHRTAHEAMMKRLAGDRPVAPLEMLADVLTTVPYYGRFHSRLYTTSMPLDRLVDAVRPEGDTPRRFDRDLRAFVTGEPQVSSLRRNLDLWWHNDEALDPLLASSPKLAEVRSLSRDLKAVATIGHEAMDLFMTDYPRFTSWYRERYETLDAASKPRGELQLAIIPAVRRLLVAAELRKTLWRMPIAERLAWLDEEAAKRTAPVEPPPTD